MPTETTDVSIAIREQLARFEKQVDEISTAEDKYVYFLLAAVAAAIAYAMERTASLPIRSHDWILSIACGLWIVSFWAGCKNRMRRLDNVHSNLFRAVIDLGVKSEPLLNWPSSEMSEARTMLQQYVSKLEAESQRAARDTDRWYGIQFRALVFGGVFFGVWHVVGMAMN